MQLVCGIIPVSSLAEEVGVDITSRRVCMDLNRRGQRIRHCRCDVVMAVHCMYLCCNN